ncbi:MAG: biopolymer transporter ExbD [Treponema sp.]|jgi:biopolymer transport protein ExbD|nr:biopolymer transporter ExbD [Treponema sp.]
MNLNRNRRQSRRRFIIPLNSMSDVAFLLLIFIMLVSLINYRKEVKVEYPEAETAKQTSAEKNLEIWIDVHGGLYLNGDPSDLSAIEDGIIATYQKAPETRIHLIADKNTRFEYVNTALQMLQILQYRVVSFVAK